MASIEHTFLGTWEIVSCTFEGVKEISGLEGIKFRLDDNNDITWYNDLINPLMEASDSSSCCDSAKVLFSCETFEVNENQPRLIFGAFAGHSIEFNVPTLNPSDMLILSCENWYTLECKRLKNDQAVGQEKEFSFIECLNDPYFSDVVIKSSDGYEYRVHACILRLNGFDCSMYIHSNSPTIEQKRQLEMKQQKNDENTNVNLKGKMPDTNHITISITLPNAGNVIENREQVLPLLKLSPMYLKPPNEYQILDQLNSKLSLSCNCLLSSDSKETKECAFNNISCVSRISTTSRSDSHLDFNNHQHHKAKNVFNFCPELMWQQLPLLDHCNAPNNMCSSRHPPLSPYRAKSPLLFATSAIDTPPSSPLTPVGVLYDLPAFLLTPILHWLYTESLLSDMDETVCEKLINFAESQPSLTKMTESFKKYSKLIKLKKFVINIIMNLHNVLNRAIQSMNPVTISHVPFVLYDTFKDCIKDCLIGCAKILQFCNIFVKDAADIARYQKNEIIKYVRSRIPIFASQLQQLLDNILKVFMYLLPEEKSELAYFLIPKVESALINLTNLMEEVKISLEKVCKDLKCSHIDSSVNVKNDDNQSAKVLKNPLITNEIKIVDKQIVNDIFGQQSHLMYHSTQSPFVDLTVHDNLYRTDKNHLMGSENDLKFVLYMFEMRKMRDIYGRISIALDIIQDKKNTFIGLDLMTKRNIIYENIDNLISCIPYYISILDMLAKRIDSKLGWKEFKFCFKLVASQINGILVKILDHKAALKDALTEICKLVEKQEFMRCLNELGLLEPSNILETELNSLCNDSSEDFNLLDSEYNKVKLNLVGHLCEPPTAAQSNLSKNALRLLHSAQLTDMEFVVHTIDNSKNIPNVQVHTFRAHRVIVASRCDCFKKALMSGMQESINRQIIIMDTSPVIFRRLLLYLYGAPIDKTVGAEQICELMLLADKYSIMDLKEICENTLNALIDEHSVLCLLGIADRYMATDLKTKCLSFLAKNAHITKTVLFKELTQSLQLEVMDLIHWYDRVAEPWNEPNSGITGSGLHNNSRSFQSPARTKIRTRKLSPS